jgi:CARDB
MNRLAAGVAGLVLCALVVATTAAATPPPRAHLRAFSCHRALDPPDRSVSVTAVMRPVAGTQHLAMKFELLMVRSGGRAPKVVRSGDLGSWVTPKNPTLGQLPGDVWNVEKPVIALAAPAKYRFKVLFRWTGAQNHVLGMAVRYSPSCRQRELRPDLLVRSITVTPSVSHSHRDLYTAVLANEGNSAAGPFNVLFAPADGTGTKTRTIARLRAHSSVTERFLGPDCATAGPPTITVDSANQVDDLDRANNSLAAVCPAVASG